MGKSFRSWLTAYESVRTDPYSNSQLTSTRFDLEGLTWDEIRNIPIPELGPD